MIDPFPATPDGRAEQAARFVDLARQHAIEPEQPVELSPLIAALLQDATAPTLDEDGDGIGDGPKEKRS